MDNNANKLQNIIEEKFVNTDKNYIVVDETFFNGYPLDEIRKLYRFYHLDRIIGNAYQVMISRKEIKK